MTDTTHECPAQRRLLREFRDNFGHESYFEARADCLRALGVPESELAELNAGVT